MEESSFSTDFDELCDYDIYGKTPPRTKILRKHKEKKQKDKGTMLSSPKVKIPLNRRNTVSTMYEDLIANADNSVDQETKRTNKRNMKLLRGSERDLKLDIASAQAAMERIHVNDDPTTPIPSYQIESCKRFKSLSCRTVQCSKSNNQLKCTSKFVSGIIQCSDDVNEECPQKRVDFYKTLSMLIRLGCGEKSIQERNTRRGMNREELLWSNEIKDIIWLELQAYHADRTPMEQDTFLCQARETVEPLLREIMSFRYNRNMRKMSIQTIDSGVHEEICSGCLSLRCLSCIDAQNDALRQIEVLMKRLEEVEYLFPSSKAFAEIYPIYCCPEFVGRVKAISLWYNMTKHQRLKMAILGRLLSSLENKSNVWPLYNEDILAESGSPSDSNNSTSSAEYSCYSKGDFSSLLEKNSDSASPYRRYIENVLKTKALHKSLNFLEKLHRHVLTKAQLTLSKPDESIFNNYDNMTDEEELKRYGCWSPEAKALDLPSYRAHFLFLAAVPLKVIHEYLLMRLEQKPENPSPLSMRLLMRELKEGLKIATFERSRIIGYFESATEGTNTSEHCFVKSLEDFDDCLYKVYSDYIDYLENWFLLDHNIFQKRLLEDEFTFSCEMVKHIPKAFKITEATFTNIIIATLKNIEIRLQAKIDDLLNISSDDIYIKQNIFSTCRELQTLFNEERENCLKTVAFCKIVTNQLSKEGCLKKIGEPIINFKCIIPAAIEKVQLMFERISLLASFDETDKSALNSRIREILMQGYRFGFEFYKEMSDGSPPAYREKLVKSMVHFANLWMRFATERCERGRGMRPRWAYQGLEFLLTVCEPNNTKYLSDEEFKELELKMDECISHVIGTTAPTTPDSGFYSASPRASLEHIRARSRGSSPNPRPTYKSQRSQANRKTSSEQLSPVTDRIDGVFVNRKEENGTPGTKRKFAITHVERCREAIDGLENEIDNKLRKQLLIGKVLCNTENKPHIRRRYVNFSWQRGIKIGQGRFGKVYTAVNNNTGEMMAVKELPLQHNDTLTIKRVAEEMKILEGINHPNLVRYFGVEVHKDEMLIFMEFCAEGTLEGLVSGTENGLPELIVRQYTNQLVSGVAVLHEHGIVHRDIKPANIFLTDGGNCLKIGDFGCATKIKSNITMPGELQGFVGTQAYMAPEVFTKNLSIGHGRAADIWSVGCVVVEMASGKRPWANFDSNYQIMFKVGMGQSPDPPDDMTDEGLEFLDMCFKHDPKERANASELLEHSFCKVGEGLL